jgi:hypothetical protein
VYRLNAAWQWRGLRERGREEGMRPFLDEKSFKPGLATYRRNKNGKR